MSEEPTGDGRQLSLSAAQKALLVQLVSYAREHKIDRTIIPVPAGPADYTIYVRQEPNMRIDGLGDLDALCAARVLSYRFNRMGNGKIYLLTRESFDAAERWRQEPLQPPASCDEAFAETEDERLWEALPALEAELRRRLPANTPAEIRQRINSVREMLQDPPPNRAQISFQLRRIARYLAENLHDRSSSEQLIAYSYWAQAIYRYLELRSRLNQ